MVRIGNLFKIGILGLGMLALGILQPVKSQGPAGNNLQPEIIVFVRDGCGHCAAEEEFFNKLKTRGPLNLTYFNLKDELSRKTWEEFTTRLQIAKVTPITVIGREYIIGFDRAETTGEEIIRLINKSKELGEASDLSLVNKNSAVSDAATCDESGNQPCEIEKPGLTVSLPLIGQIDSRKYPLLILALMLGFFDGFNPCAMWVLVTFLLILLQTGSRKKMVVFAGTFVLAEAIMYAAILTVWYKTWNFVQLDGIVTPIIGLVSIGGGIMFIREWRKKELECKVTDLTTRHKTHVKLQQLASERFTFLTFLGILGVAFSVNIIEFACSIGIPQAFTKILELNQVTTGQNIFLIAAYILAYMIDDFIVFGLAIYGADKLALTTKYSKWSNLIGGILMIGLGLVMILRPGLVLF